LATVSCAGLRSGAERTATPALPCGSGTVTVSVRGCAVGFHTTNDVAATASSHTDSLSRAHCPNSVAGAYAAADTKPQYTHCGEPPAAHCSASLSTERKHMHLCTSALVVPNRTEPNRTGGVHRALQLLCAFCLSEGLEGVRTVRLTPRHSTPTGGTTEGLLTPDRRGSAQGTADGALRRRCLRVMKTGRRPPGRGRPRCCSAARVDESNHAAESIGSATALRVRSVEAVDPTPAAANRPNETV
jgi:hypothetical protein